MHKTISDVFIYYRLAPAISFWTAVVIMFVLMLFLCWLANFAAKRFISTTVHNIIKKSQNRWDDIFYENRAFSGFSHLAPALVIIFFADYFPVWREFLNKFALIYITLTGYFIFDKIVDSVDGVYKTFEASKEKPVTNYLQVTKIICLIVCVIIAIGVMIDQSPWALLSGLGALTAVLMVVFKDSIMGLSAGIQLSANNMLHIGDWIEMPKYGADGEVIEISLNTVKVQNWDKTIIMIPIYCMISESFKNWRGMFAAGGRRIKRSIFIDAFSISFASPETVAGLKKNKKIWPYIEQFAGCDLKDEELTNAGIFRNYATEYLKKHPRVESGMRLIARQLQPGENGLPIEIYAFCKETDWTVYESVQADIIEHLIAVAPQFGLKIFQKYSSKN